MFFKEVLCNFFFWLWILLLRHVTRVADCKDDELEALYERKKKKDDLKKAKEEEGLQVDRVDALPIKTLEGELRYRTGSKIAFF